MLSQCPHAFCDHPHGIQPFAKQLTSSTGFDECYSCSSFVGDTTKSRLEALVSEYLPLQLSSFVHGSNISDDETTDSEIEEKEVLPVSAFSFEFSQASLFMLFLSLADLMLYLHEQNGTEVEIREFDWMKLRWSCWRKGTVISHTFTGIVVNQFDVFILDGCSYQSNRVVPQQNFMALGPRKRMSGCLRR